MTDLPYVPTGTWWTRVKELWITVRVNLVARIQELDAEPEMFIDLTKSQR